MCSLYVCVFSSGDIWIYTDICRQTTGVYNSPMSDYCEVVTYVCSALCLAYSEVGTLLIEQS